MADQTISRPHGRRLDRSTMQQRAEGALADHPYRLELRGAPRSLVWPPVCAGCGAPAGQRLAVRKVFARPRVRGRSSSAGPWHTITAVRVPFCAACVQRHREAVRRPRPARELLHLLLLLTPMAIPLAGSAYFGLISMRSARAVPLDAPGALVAWGMPALMAFIFVWSLAAVWLSTRPYRVERQTEVTRSCDFSDDVSQPFERERRIYALRCEPFARALAEANRDRVWTAADDARSSRRRLAVLGVLVAACAAVWLCVVLGP